MPGYSRAVGYDWSDMTELSPTAARLVDEARAVARESVRPTDLHEQLEEAIELVFLDESRGVQALREALDEFAAYRHIIVEDGRVVAFSMHARSLLDSAYWACESPTTSHELRARIDGAVALMHEGDEAGIRALELALESER